MIAGQVVLMVMVAVSLMSPCTGLLSAPSGAADSVQSLPVSGRSTRGSVRALENSTVIVELRVKRPLAGRNWALFVALEGRLRLRLRDTDESDLLSSSQLLSSVSLSRRFSQNFVSTQALGCLADKLSVNPRYRRLPNPRQYHGALLAVQ